MKQTPTLKQQIEDSLACSLLQKMYQREIALKDATIIAREILDLLPENTPENKLADILQKVSQKHQSLADVCFRYLKLLDTQKSEEEITKVKDKISHLIYGHPS